MNIKQAVVVTSGYYGRQLVPSVQCFPQLPKTQGFRLYYNFTTTEKSKRCIRNSRPGRQTDPHQEPTVPTRLARFCEILLVDIIFLIATTEWSQTQHEGLKLRLRLTQMLLQ